METSGIAFRERSHRSSSRSQAGNKKCRARFPAWTRIWKNTGATSMRDSSCIPAIFCALFCQATLYARVEERVFIESPLDGFETMVPGVRVIEHPNRRRRTAPVESDVAVADRVIIHLPDEEVHETYIEIRNSKSGHCVVTVVEVLSPSNKREGDGRKKFLEKQREMRTAGVSLVEIDLLCAGRPIFPISNTVLPKSHRTDYRVCVRLGGSPRSVGVYAVPLRQQLPGVPIPLRNREESAKLDLQAVFDQVYERGEYEMTVDYTANPNPPLSPDDATWADELLRAKGLR